MSEQGQFTVELEQLDGYEFKVRFGLPEVPDLLMDEPPPLGGRAGPNASRVLAAAVANCLSASLLYCLKRDQAPGQAVRSSATCRVVRGERGRLRIGGIDVRIQVGQELLVSEKLRRCLELFEDFCVVTASVREGIPIQVEVVDERGERVGQG